MPLRNIYLSSFVLPWYGFEFLTLIKQAANYQSASHLNITKKSNISRNIKNPNKTCRSNVLNETYDHIFFELKVQTSSYFPTISDIDMILFVEENHAILLTFFEMND